MGNDDVVGVEEVVLLVPYVRDFVVVVLVLGEFVDVGGFVDGSSLLFAGVGLSMLVGVNLMVGC